MLQDLQSLPVFPTLYLRDLHVTPEEEVVPGLLEGEGDL